jgi:hypothetical protein
MKRTKQNRSKGRRRMTMKRIRRNKVMYGGAVELIRNSEQLNDVLKHRNVNNYKFRLVNVMIDRKELVNGDKNKLEEYLKENPIFDGNGEIAVFYELSYM